MPTLRACLVPAVALFAYAGCSSTPNPVANGGVDIQLTNPTAGIGTNCPDRGFEMTLFAPDGNKSLLVDGSNGATVHCTVGAANFNATVSLSGQTFQLSGTVTQEGGNFVSKDASLNIAIATGSYASDPAMPCTLTFSTYSTGSGGNNAMESGSLSCPNLLNSGGASQSCAINAAFAAHDVLSFHNCK